MTPLQCIYLTVSTQDDCHAFQSDLTKLEAWEKEWLMAFSPDKIKESAYKTYVRPLLEYSASIWDPWQKKYINQIEMVQHRAVRYIFNDYQHTSSITSMLNKLSFPTLEKRRKISSLTMFHKIYHRKVRINFPTYIKPTLRHRFSIPYSRINAHKSSFFPRTARLWNDLPPDLSSCQDLEAFRAGLAHHLNWPPSNISSYIHHIITIHPPSSLLTHLLSC